MFKLLVLGLLIFIAYRLFWGNPGIGAPQNKDKIRDRRSPEYDDDGDYVDYEEID